MEIADRVKEFIKDLLVALQSARFYSTAHKKFAESVDKAFKDVQEILLEKNEIIIGIIGEDFAFQREIFFEFATMPFAQEVMDSLKRNGIEKIIFNSYIHRGELDTFINFLVYIQERSVKVNGQEQLAILGIENIAVEQLSSPISPYEAQKKPEKIAFSVYEDYLNKVTGYFEALLNNKTIDYLALKLNIFGIKDNLLGMQRISKLAYVKMRPVPVFVHSANVSILAMYFSLKLGFSREEILETAIAALFHDIGRIYLSRKRKELTDTKNHCEEGAVILLKYSRTIGQLPVLVSFEHHLRYDLKGYPKLRFKYKPHIVSALVSICDVYAAISQRRGPKYGYSPDIIYKLMMKEKGNAFNPELLEIFFRIIGIWPVGTIVSLNDGRVGVVCEEDETDIARPKVEIMDYPIGKVIDLKSTEGLKIEKALNPFTEGKKYLDLLESP